MSVSGLKPKYLALLSKMNENAFETWQGNGGVHTVLAFVVSTRDVPALMPILSDLVGTERYAANFSFKDWEVGQIHVSLIDPQPGEEDSLKARCTEANISLLSPNLGLG